MKNFIAVAAIVGITMGAFAQSNKKMTGPGNMPGGMMDSSGAHRMMGGTMSKPMNAMMPHMYGKMDQMNGMMGDMNGMMADSVMMMDPVRRKDAAKMMAAMSGAMKEMSDQMAKGKPDAGQVKKMHAKMAVMHEKLEMMAKDSSEVKK